MLFVYQCYASPQPWGLANLSLALGIFAGALVWVVLLTMVGLAVSAWVKWRVIATGAIFAVVFVPAGVGGIASAILRSTFPLSVIQRQGQSVVINQGGEAVAAGATYQVVTLGKELIDPQSGQSLGPTESLCCTVKVDRVTPTLSYGHIVETGIMLADPFVAGSMELRDEVQSAALKPAAALQTARRRPTVAAKKSGKQPVEADTNSNW